MKKTKKILTEEYELLFLKENNTTLIYQYRKLELAATKGYLELFTYLYDLIPKSKRFISIQSEINMVLAIKNSRFNIVKFLFEKNVKISKKTTTELIVYTLSNNDEMSNFLLDKGYETENRNFNEKEFIFIALKRTNLKLLEKLFSSYQKWLTPLDYTSLLIEYAEEESFKFLINKINPQILETELLVESVIESVSLFWKIDLSAFNILEKIKLKIFLLLCCITDKNKFEILLDKINYEKKLLLLIDKMMIEEAREIDNSNEQYEYSISIYNWYYKDTHQILKDFLSNEKLTIEIKPKIFKKLEDKAKSNYMNIEQYLEYIITKED